RLRNCRFQLCRSLAFPWGSAQSASIRGARTEETGELSYSRGVASIQLAGALPPSHCKIPAFFARVAELADAYGSGPYGATRGGSSPLASSYSCRATDSQIYPQLLDVSRDCSC